MEAALAGRPAPSLLPSLNDLKPSLEKTFTKLNPIGERLLRFVYPKGANMIA
jgi:hypothetical protein